MLFLFLIIVALCIIKNKDPVPHDHEHFGREKNLLPGFKYRLKEGRDQDFSWGIEEKKLRLDHF